MMTEEHGSAEAAPMLTIEQETMLRVMRRAAAVEMDLLGVVEPETPREDHMQGLHIDNRVFVAMLNAVAGPVSPEIIAAARAEVLRDRGLPPE